MFLNALVLDLDITYVFVLVLFLIPLLILNGLVFQPFLKVFRNRHDHIQGAMERADQQLAEAESRARSFEAKLEVATARGVDARNRIRTEAQRAMAERLDEERKRLGAKVEAALREVGTAKEQALREVDRESRGLAETTATKLLGRAL